MGEYTWGGRICTRTLKNAENRRKKKEQFEIIWFFYEKIILNQLAYVPFLPVRGRDLRCSVFSVLAGGLKVHAS